MQKDSEAYFKVAKGSWKDVFRKQSKRFPAQSTAMVYLCDDFVFQEPHLRLFISIFDPSAPNP